MDFSNELEDFLQKKIKPTNQQNICRIDTHKPEELKKRIRPIT